MILFLKYYRHITLAHSHLLKSLLQSPDQSAFAYDLFFFTWYFEFVSEQVSNSIILQKKNLKFFLIKIKGIFFIFLHTTALKTMYIQKLCNLCIVLIREYCLCSVYLYSKQSLTRSELYYGRDFIYIYHLESLQQYRYLVNFRLFNKCFDGQSHSPGLRLQELVCY